MGPLLATRAHRHWRAILGVLIAGVVAVATIAYAAQSFIYLAGPLGFQGSFARNGYSAVSFTSDANHTGTLPDYAGESVVITSTTTLTATRQLVYPLVEGATFIVTNDTTGGQTITVGGSTGTLCSVPNAQSVTCNCPDGANYASAGGGGGAAFDAAAYIPWTAAQGGTGITSPGATGNVLTSLDGGAWGSEPQFSYGYANATAIGAIALPPGPANPVGMLAYDQATAITYQLTSLTPDCGTAPCANGTWVAVTYPQVAAWSPGFATVCTANIALTTDGVTCNGVTMSASRVLLVGQTTTSQNGPYTSGTPFVRTSDGNTSGAFVVGKAAPIVGGSLAGTSYIYNGATSPTIGTTALTFVANGTSAFSPSSPGPLGNVTPSTGAFTSLTLTTPLAVANGGSNSSTAPTTGQLEIAFSSTVISPTTVTGDIQFSTSTPGLATADNMTGWPSGNTFGGIGANANLCTQTCDQNGFAADGGSPLGSGCNFLTTTTSTAATIAVHHPSSLGSVSGFDFSFIGKSNCGGGNGDAYWATYHVLMATLGDGGVSQTSSVVPLNTTYTQNAGGYGSSIAVDAGGGGYIYATVLPVGDAGGPGCASIDWSLCYSDQVAK